MDNSNVRSYDRYAGLFNKACSSVLFLVIAVLTSVLSVGYIINLFDTISSGDFLTILFTLLPALFITLTTIGLWILFINAKKNSISGGTFGLVKCYPKYDQIIKAIVFVILIIAILAIIVGMFVLKSEIDQAVDEAGASVEELQNELRDALKEADIPEEYMGVVNNIIGKIDYYLTTGLVIITVVGVLVIVFLIFELIRCAMLVKFLVSASKMFKTGHMVAPPTMFFCVLNYIFAVINIVGSFSIIGFDWQMCVTGVILALIGVIFMINRKELNDIYGAWKTEIGMISPDASAANNAYTPNMNGYVNPQQYAPQPPVQQPVQQTVQQPVQEAPVAEAPVEAQPANENKTEENNTAQ